MIIAPRGPRSVLCVVVVTTSAYGTAIGMHAADDQSGDVRDVGEQKRADLFCDFAENLEVELARIGGRAGHDYFRPLLASRASRTAS